MKNIINNNYSTKEKEKKLIVRILKVYTFIIINIKINIYYTQIFKQVAITSSK